MIQIALFAIAGMMLAVFVGNMRREIGIWIALVTGVIVFFYAIRKFEYMVDMFRTMTEYTRIKEEYIAVVLKMIGIAYISEFTATLCKDAGQHAIACQVDFFGKMSMVVVSLPVLQTLLETIGEMMP